MSPTLVGGFFTTSATWEAPWGAWDDPKVRGCTTGSPEALVAALALGGAVEQKAVLRVPAAAPGEQGSRLLGAEGRRD